MGNVIDYFGLAYVLAQHLFHVNMGQLEPSGVKLTLSEKFMSQ